VSRRPTRSGRRGRPSSARRSRSSRSRRSSSPIRAPPRGTRRCSAGPTARAYPCG
jgi:hypothetical protein